MYDKSVNYYVLITLASVSSQKSKWPKRSAQFFENTTILTIAIEDESHEEPRSRETLLEHLCR